MVLETLLKRIKERNHRGIVNQTEKLDPQTRQQLQEFLEVVPGEQKELEDLEEELWDASAKLNDMVEKEEFIGIRLKAYQDKLREMAHGCDSTPPATSEADSDDEEEEEEGGAGEAVEGRSERESGSSDDEQPSSMGNSAKQKEHQEALAKIQQIHNDMKASIQTFKTKIAKMEKRKCQLRLHLEECQVFLETAEEMERLETELALEEATVENSNDGTISVHASEKEPVASSSEPEKDEEVGHVQHTPPGTTDFKKEEEEDHVGRKSETTGDAPASRIAVADEELGDPNAVS